MDMRLEVVVIPVSDVDGLADALRRAKAAHGKYEEDTGKADPDWPEWYARYLADEASGQGGE